MTDHRGQGTAGDGEWDAVHQWGWLLPMPVEQVDGVGVRRAAALAELGIRTVGQLLLRLPRRYIDRSRVLPVSQAPLGEEVTLIVSVLDPGHGAARQGPKGRGRFGKSRRPTRARVGDDSGELYCVWFGGHYQSLKPGDTIAVSGKIERFGGRLQIVHPEIEPIGEGAAPGQTPNTMHTGAIVPVYGSGEDLKASGLTSRRWRALVRGALAAFGATIEDRLPAEVRDRLGLPGMRESLHAVHAPASLEETQQARRRLAFDELLGLQLELGRRRAARLHRPGLAHAAGAALVQRLLASLPFGLTAAQKRVLAEICHDMASPTPMRRLLHGEVGSGKTVVALGAVLTAVEGGYQVAFMAPTEVLAEQHFATIQASPAFAGLSTVLLVGGQGERLRGELLTAVQSGGAQVVIGTHALIQKEVQFARLGLIVVDEEHRFGVVQRQTLYSKGPNADVLVMSATPIPRSLALTLYGDLDVSTLDELPAGREPVRTVVRRPSQRAQVLAFVGEELGKGCQAYIVYPVIDESESGSLTSAVEAFEELSSGPLSRCEVGFLHGRMSSAEKSAVMGAFSRGESQALVCTSLVEVGLDVPRATIMVVEHAERFGLAQLHQLRGRVGRGGGGERSYCILIAHAQKQEDDAAQRLQVLCDSQDGFEIAQKDLELRGPGELQGTRQAGMPDLLVADLCADEDLLVAARSQAARLLTGTQAESGEM